MQIKPHYETYRYNTESCAAESRSIVECRFAGGEIGTVLSAHARVSPATQTCENGEVRYSGKLVVTLVYEDTDKKVCRSERGAEFSHSAQNSCITPSSYAVPFLSADDVTVRREGSGVYVSVVVNARFSVYANVAAEYLSGGEGIVLKRESQTLVRIVTASSEAQADDEFETDYAIDALTHSERVYLSDVRAEEGRVALSGEIALNICALKEDGSLCSYERLIPFHAEATCEESLSGMLADGTVSVEDAKLVLTTDEEKGKCRVEAEITLHADCALYIKEEISACVDGYSAERELLFETSEKESRVPTETLCFTERIAGTASFTEEIDYSTALLAALCPRAEISCANGEAQGAVFADTVLADKDGNHKSARLTLPFLFPVRCDADAETEASAIVCGLSVRQRREGVVEAEATLKATIKRYRRVSAKYLSSVSEGAAIETNDAAISVYLPRAGDGLWETAKRLGRTPEELEKSNPELTFPLCGNERILVYRQKN